MDFFMDPLLDSLFCIMEVHKAPFLPEHSSTKNTHFLEISGKFEQL